MDEHDKRAREWYAQELNEQPPDCPCYEQHIESLASLLRAAVAAERERCAVVCEATAGEAQAAYDAVTPIDGTGEDEERFEAWTSYGAQVAQGHALAARIRGGAPAQAEQRVSEAGKHDVDTFNLGLRTGAGLALITERSRIAARLRARADGYEGNVARYQREGRTTLQLLAAESARLLRSEADALEQGE